MKENHLVILGGGSSFENREDFHVAIRGWKYNPQPALRDQWWGWVPRQLGEGWDVHVPTMPNKHNADYQAWKIWFEKIVSDFSPPAILVGQSLGASFLVRYFSEGGDHLPVQLHLVSPAVFRDTPGKDIGEFATELEGIEKLNKLEVPTFIYHSRDDDVVPFWHGEKLAEALPEATFMTFEDRGHFNVDTFPELLENIQKYGNT